MRLFQRLALDKNGLAINSATVAVRSIRWYRLHWRIEKGLWDNGSKAIGVRPRLILNLIIYHV